MSDVLQGLQPKILFDYFGKLSRIPRCSGNEKGVVEFLLQLARQKGLEAKSDSTGNVVIRVPASPAKENAPVVVLQGHLDMVGERSADSSHDFSRDPIKIKSDGKYLTAEGTTLGADNGIGVAAALSFIDEREAVHGPLELLFTVDEERGLTGARGLSGDFIRGRMLLNLDSEEYGAIYVGCAGGADTGIRLSLRRAKSEGQSFRLVVKGLKGGHSGLDINTGRANAIKILAHLLSLLREKAAFGLASIDAGDKHNAIPREALAGLWLGNEAQKALEQLLEKVRRDLQLWYGKTDAGVALELHPAQDIMPPLAAKAADRLLDFLLALPHGVLAMSQEVAGLVETSTNLAVVKTQKNAVDIVESSRSSVMPALRAAQREICALARLAGARPEPDEGYPGWQPNMDSPLLKKASAVMERFLGRPPHIKAVHAGLECGIIGEKVGGMDMISFGPDINWPHSPSERVEIASVEKFYTFLRGLLEELAG
jgi:dipeptidase D